MALPKCPVEWHPSPVLLHVPLPELSTSAGTPESLPSSASASPGVAFQGAEHILFFNALGGPVMVAPLTVKVGGSTSENTAPRARHSAPAAEVVDLPDAMVPSAADGTSAVSMEEWTDAVDEEVAAFFGEDDS
ncbi:hypothetical protein ABL78_5867 [Leptomonas seymouri]|uniref:Uncharacterized protein n=1 Tax=Leptomonas seymouri TaxID=5684 RepID=A0A0N1PAC3_LEPSE|nr:hypothetical protein ABL78_5867 [Leptomonas seymouri]|eukprot:KPI85062.1 hypothetical protein ABL78_5867 [Leptomonas seymouri]